MPFANVNGINVHYEVAGSGPPMIMFAPGAMDSAIDRWGTHYFWKFVKPIETFAKNFTVIAYDRREAGQSGGRVERLHWGLYSAEAAGLLTHLGIDKAFILGSCMGGNLVLRFGIDYPERARALVCYWPTGGVRWRTRMRKAFEDHAAFVGQNGLDGVVKRAKEKPGSFGSDAVLGPWGNTISREPAFANGFQELDKDRYLALSTHSGWDLFDRDTAVGAEPEELMGIKLPTAIVPGDDAAHALSAAHYVRECVPNNRFLEGPVKSQTPEGVVGFIQDFLAELA